MTFAQAATLAKELENLQDTIKEQEDLDRLLLDHYKEQGEDKDADRIRERIEGRMLQRGKIAEVIDIIDELKITA